MRTLPISAHSRRLLGARIRPARLRFRPGSTLIRTCSCPADRQRRRRWLELRRGLLRDPMDPNLHGGQGTGSFLHALAYFLAFGFDVVIEI